ncbi:MAG TPA: S-adenosylmethionine:tRNA ribosyltransferase-isomerase, partial [Longimicrobiales bacterium]|nr:S-adenosylmethionine:tRNA ribosyltransferase-isomerase [Longimicrobiales bacterium]
MSPAPATTFTVPPELIATGPPESRGKRRDQVRLLVARPGRLHHTLFRRLGDHLDEGDLLVVNTSATRPAAIDALWRSRPVVVHLSTPLDDGGWLVEIRSEGGHQPVLDAEPGDRLQLRGGGLATLRSAAFPPARRLWQAALSLPGPVGRYLA